MAHRSNGGASPNLRLEFEGAVAGECEEAEIAEFAVLQDEKGRPRVKLDRESFQRIVDWLDTNALFYGDYSWNKAEWRKPSPGGEQALREHIRKTDESRARRARGRLGA